MLLHHVNIASYRHHCLVSLSHNSITWFFPLSHKQVRGLKENSCSVFFFSRRGGVKGCRGTIVTHLYYKKNPLFHGVRAYGFLTGKHSKQHCNINLPMAISIWNGCRLKTIYTMNLTYRGQEYLIRNTNAAAWHFTLSTFKHCKNKS